MKSSRLRNFEVFYRNSKEYHSLKREIFGENVYFVEFDKKNPLIFDVGAHIGMASLYFKTIVPEARIVAFEPLGEVVEILRKNIEQNQLEDVMIHPYGVGENEGKVDFFIDVDGEWLSSSSFAERSWSGEQENKKISVNIEKLSDYMIVPIDLLKLDVEGAEEEVFEDIKDKLHLVDHILFEYHPKWHGTPERILEILKKAGFETTFHSRGREVDWRKRKGLLMGEATRKS